MYEYLFKGKYRNVEEVFGILYILKIEIYKMESTCYLSECIGITAINVH
jgi:hypothetical protein